jgi:diphthamide biosynthesis protein 2
VQEASTPGQELGVICAGSLTWCSPPTGIVGGEQTRFFWVGPSEGSAALTELLMTFSGHGWAFFDPVTERGATGVPEEMSRRLMRRFYLLSKAKEATLVGLLVGSLGPDVSRRAVSVLQRLAKAAGKKAYTVLMGKPNPGKLANFPEVRSQLNPLPACCPSPVRLLLRS